MREGLIMSNELITTEYAGPASRQVGPLPCHDVRAWWVAQDDGTIGRVKLDAGRELKRHVRADHVEFVHMDMSTYNSPHMNAMITFRVLTKAQFAARAELRARVYTQCELSRCGGDPGQLVRMENGLERALCFGCWYPIKSTCQVLHWIKANGKLQI